MSSEDGEAIALVEWVQRQHPTFAGRLLHIANEAGGRGYYQSAAFHTKRKRMGVRRGVPDYFFAVPQFGFGGLWLELKRAGGTLRPDQRDFLDSMQAAGYCAAAAWGWQAASFVLGTYLRGGTWTRAMGCRDARGLESLDSLTLTGTPRKIPKTMTQAIEEGAKAGAAAVIRESKIGEPHPPGSRPFLPAKGKGERVRA